MMNPWCHYATVRLEIADFINLEDNVSVADLHTVIKRFDACCFVPDDILSKAYKQKLRVCHPDRNAGDIHANEKTDLVVKAWAELKDPTRRRNYNNEIQVMLKTRLQKLVFLELMQRNQHLAAAAKETREQQQLNH